MGSAHEVLEESLGTVFGEAHFIVNLHNFLQLLALPRHTFPPGVSFAPIPPGRTTSKTFPLGTSGTALMCVFSSILNHS